MKKFVVLAGFALLLVALSVRATTVVESIDVNTILLYTSNDVGVDVDIQSDENGHLILQLYDNNVFREEKTLDVSSPDGNLYDYSVSFTLQFVSGNHILDANLMDANYNTKHIKSTSFDVQVNPEVFDENISMELIQQYLLPMARALSQCMIDKADLNILYTQNSATMRALENSVAIANEDTAHAENMLSNKETELTSCSTARSTCEADKATADSKLNNARDECDSDMASLKDEEESDCDDQLLLKDQSIASRETMLLEKQNEANDAELLAFTFGALFFIIVGLVAFLYFKGAIKT